MHVVFMIEVAVWLVIVMDYRITTPIHQVVQMGLSITAQSAHATHHSSIRVRILAGIT